MSRGPSGPSDWPVYLAAIVVFALFVIWLLTLTGKIHP